MEQIPTQQASANKNPAKLQVSTDHGLSAWDLLKLSLRVFRTKPTRTILTILGMSVGIGTVVFLVSLGYGLQDLLVGNLTSGESALLTLDVSYTPESRKLIDTQTISKIRATEGVDNLTPIAEFSGEISYGDQTAGIIDTKIVKPSYFKFSGMVPDIGQTFSDEEPGAIVTEQALLVLGIASTTPRTSVIGHDISGKVDYPKPDGTVDKITVSKVKIIGIITDERESPLAYIPYSSVAKEPSMFRNMLIKAKNADYVDSLTEKFGGVGSKFGFIVSAKAQLVRDAKKVTNAITTILLVFGTAALLVSAIGMFNTMIVGFLERIYEVGVMKSLGATDSDVQNLFLMESFVIGLLGGISGVALGIGAGALINIIMSTLSTTHGSKALTLFITPTWFAVATLILSACIGIVSGYWPSRNASKLSPREAFVRK
ncbi:MAG: ABC transporter permease [Candidatus Yonathbacteria bacterium]|nr:ABC transporter permease [Candidatus Yonathbacteria bacterium]